ncbi:MAG: PAS domain-containing protein [Candidatus Kapabacteria bacterium]|nr:PAS domain-containing protein [Candidatus Kapabacteria bacterium]
MTTTYRERFAVLRSGGGVFCPVFALLILMTPAVSHAQEKSSFTYAQQSDSTVALLILAMVGSALSAYVLSRMFVRRRMVHQPHLLPDSVTQQNDTAIESALAESCVNHRDILDAIPGTAYVCVYTVSTRCLRTTYMSNRAEELFGFAARDFVDGSRSISERVGNDFTEIIRSQAEECSSSMSRFDVTFPYCHPDGSVRWIQAVATPTVLNTDEIQWSGYMSDVTPAILSEQQRLEYEHTLVNITNAVPGVVFQFVMNSDGTQSWFPFISKAIKEFSGIDQDEWIDDTRLFSSLIHPDDYPLVQHSIIESRDMLEQWCCEFRMYRRDTGNLVWVSGKSIPERLNDGSTMWYGVLTDITMQKTNEVRAENSKQLLIEAQKVACLGSWECVLETEQMVWTDQMFEIFHRNPHSGVPLFTEFIASYFHPSSHDDIHDSIQLAIAQRGGRFEHDVRATTDNGQPLYIHFVCQVVCRAGEPTILIGTVMDISERKSVEDKLRDANSVIEKSTSVLFRWAITENGMWNLMFVSGNIEQWGYGAEEILANPGVLGSIVYESDLEYLTTVNARNRERRIANYSIEYRIVSRSGKQRWVEEQVFYQFSPYGIPVTCDSIVTDITARKEAEISLNDHVEELKLRDHLLDTITSTLQRIVISTDAESSIQESLGHIAIALDADRMFVVETQSDLNTGESIALNTMHWYSPQFDFRSSYTPQVSIHRIGFENVLGQLQNGHTVQHPIEDYSALTQRVLRGIGVQSQLIIPVFLRNSFWGFIALQNCREIRTWQDYEVNILMGAATTIAGAIERSRTERKLVEYAEYLEDAKHRLEEQATELLETNFKVEVAREQAESANRAKSAFLSSMSHELRTPLNAILGFTQIMLRDALLSEMYRKHLNTMQRSGEHLLGMINDILDISKIEAGRLELQNAPVSIGDMIDDIRDMFSVRCNEKNLSLVISIHPRVPQFIEADLTRLRQIIINLVGNSVKFTPNNGAIHIILDCAGTTTRPDDTTPRATIHVGVCDTGRGIPQEQLLTIFEPFRQVNGMHSEGTGLGLAICSRLVAMMGGVLKVESTLGKGTTFWFEAEFPVIAEHLAQSKEQRMPVTGITNPRLRTILLVDDIQSNRDVITGMLSPFGFEFIEAIHGAEAVQELQNGLIPDIIFMDLLMPVMTGEDAMRAIRSNHAWNTIPIIAITASGFDGKREKLISSGFNDYIRKPFEEEDLFSVIEKYTDCRFMRNNPQHTTSTPVMPKPLQTVADIIASLPPTTASELTEAIELQDFDTVRDMLANMDVGESNQREAFSILHTAAVSHDFKLFVELSGMLAE